MKVFHVEQGSPEWFELRRGVPTASNFDRILTPKTGKLSAAAEEYICELIADKFRLSPPVPGYVNRAMQNGIDTEPEARRWYQMEANLDVVQVGFCTTEDSRFGFSPDGLVGTDGGLELKCPEGKIHVRWLLAGGLPAEHKLQCHGPLALAILDPTIPFKWWDWVSYCPEFKERPARRVRVVPDEFTAALAVALEQFHERYTQALNRVKEMS